MPDPLREVLTDPQRTIETAGPGLAWMLFGWDGPMWRYRNPWGPWTQGDPPISAPGMEVDDD